MAFTEINAFTESLISYVRQNECLFDSIHPDYRNSTVKDQLWADFGKTVNPKLTGEQVYKKWNSLKQSYTREVREKWSGKGRGKRKTWKWYSALEFLDGRKRMRSAGKPADSKTSDGSVTASETHFSDLLREREFLGQVNGSTCISPSKLPVSSNKAQQPNYFVLNTAGIQANPFKPPVVDQPDELTYYLLSLKPSLERLKADRNLLEETKMEIQRVIYDKSKLLPS